MGSAGHIAEQMPSGCLLSVLRDGFHASSSIFGCFCIIISRLRHDNNSQPRFESMSGSARQCQLHRAGGVAR